MALPGVRSVVRMCTCTQPEPCEHLLIPSVTVVQKDRFEDVSTELREEIARQRYIDNDKLRGRVKVDYVKE